MKINTLRTKIVSLFLVLSLLPLGALGCDADFESMVLELLEEWSDAHDVNPTTLSGAANLAKRTASGSTGDEEADAAIGLVKTVKDIQEGDKLMAEGEKLRTQGKLDEAATKMDAAIEKRPNDWTYRVSRSAVAFSQNNASTAREQQEAAWMNMGYEKLGGDAVRNLQWSQPMGRNYNRTQMLRFHNQNITELESSSINTANMDKDTKALYYSSLRDSYQALYWMTGNQADGETARRYKELGQQAGAGE